MIVKQTETSYSVREVCRNCHGKGHTLRLVDNGHGGQIPVDDQCEVCHGRGNDIDLIGKWKPCPVCEGKGIVKKHYYVEITVQPIKEEE